ncbi:helix-turn-helix domain-containing protein [Candidatus Micrarchaeota archaeon]|nr:helix-turn-helix domain-containing protein [Candidatus Micrarchaeota archaeon]
MAEKSKALYEFRKQVKALKEYRGRGTELVTVYITPGYPIHEIASKLRDEYGQAGNIKSKTTQKNVQGALERILNHLKTFKKTPENGVALFAGNISEKEGRTDIQLFTIEPPMPLHTQFYRCESIFVTEPLEELSEKTDSYGLVVLDGKEATIAVLAGKKINVIKHVHTTAHQKVAKGGQCIHESELVTLADGSIVPILEATEKCDLASLDFASQKTLMANCDAVFRRQAQKAYILTTKNPKTTIQTTPEHVFFVIGSEGIAEKHVENLKVGDRLVSVREIAAPLASYVRLEACIPLSTPTLNAAGCNTLTMIRQQRGLRQKDVARSIQTDQMSVSELERGTANFKKERLARILLFYGLDEGKFYSKYVVQKPLIQFPETLNPPLAQMLGYLIGDGTHDGNRFIFYEPDRQCVLHYKQLIENTFGVKCKVKPKPHRGYHELRAYSKYLVEAIETLFPEALDKKVPRKVMQSPSDVTAAFAKGLFDAEGSVGSGRVAIAMANKQVIHVLHALLLRQGIISSVGPKKAKHQPQYQLEVNDYTSLKRFAEVIGFSHDRKQRALYAVLARKTNRNYTDQIPLNGRLVSRLAKQMGLRHARFKGLPGFLNGQRNISREIFANRVLPVFKTQLQRLSETQDLEDPKTQEAQRILEFLEKTASGTVIPAILAKKTSVKPTGQFIDLTIPQTQNFIVNGLVVHNSAARYDRLHTEAVEYYYKRIGEAMDAFLNVKNFKGVIVGGPGPTKENFLKANAFNYQLNVLGTVDTGYTDEYGLRELLEKGQDLIAQQESVKEKQLIDRFMKEVSTNGLAAYGYTDIKQKLENHQLEALLVSEDLDLMQFDAVCSQCGKVRTVFGEKFEESECSCGGKYRLKSDTHASNALIEEAERQNVPVELISRDTAEGATFYATFKGLGAFLRYR